MNGKRVLYKTLAGIISFFSLMFLPVFLFGLNGTNAFNVPVGMYCWMCLPMFGTLVSISLWMWEPGHKGGAL